MTITRDPIYVKSNQEPKELVVGKDERVNFVLTNDPGQPLPIIDQVLAINARVQKDSDQTFENLTSYALLPAPDQSVHTGVVQVYMAAIDHTADRVGTVFIDIYVNNVLKVAWEARLEVSEAQG